MIIFIFYVPSLAEALHLVQTAANQSNEAMQKIVGSCKNNITIHYNTLRYITIKCYYPGLGNCFAAFVKKRSKKFRSKKVYKIQINSLLKQYVNLNYDKM